MKALFIFKSENFLAPIGLCIISAVARKEGWDVYLSEMNSEDPLDRIAKLEPDIVAYSSSTGEAKHYIRLNSKIKERFPEIFSIMGGPHPTFFPEMIHNTTLDAICVGEGEGGFREILNAVAERRSLKDIPNIYTKENKNLTLRNLVEDLDSLPHPDYSLLYDNTPMGSYPLKNFITSRGCPYSCTYCFNTAWNKLYSGRGKILRRHSVEYVVEDIERVKEKWPLSNVKFYDDIFCYSADGWLEEFCEKYKKRIGLPFFVLTRADLLTEDAVKLLKYAGCRTISMSIEAGNPGIRNNLLKRDMSDEQAINAHRLCRKYDIVTFTNCIIGLPQTSIKNEIESIDLSIKCKVDWVEFLIFHPYPKTELGERCIQLGMYTPDYDRMHTSYMYSSPLNCFTAKEKNVHRNLSTLGAVAVVLPAFRNIIVDHLIHWKHNKIFTFIFYIIKMHVIRKKVYVTRTSFRNSTRIFLRSLKQELFRHESKD